MNVPEEVKMCYQFSSYLLDPNKHRYHHIIRIMAIALRFVCNLKCSLKKKRTLSYDKKDLKCISLTDEEMLNARNYYFRKATQEVKEFMKTADYEKISVEKNEILFYTGRILPTEKISSVNRLSNIMQDLCATTFCVPLVYKHSPLAYSIVNEIHWFSDVAKHSGPETIWRYVLQLAFIFSGRALIKKFKLNCIRCRYLRKKFIDIEMGPVSKHNLNIAPPFYVSQTDIFGPLKAFDPCTKRKTIKVWFVVFCCATTATIGCTYQYGMINEIERDGDEVIRRVKVKYRNYNENFDRFSWRSVRQLVIIHPVDELTIMEELGQLSSHYAL